MGIDMVTLDQVSTLWGGGEHSAPAAPSFASVVGRGKVQPQSALAVQDGGADFTVDDRKKMRKGTT